MECVIKLRDVAQFVAGVDMSDVHYNAKCGTKVNEPTDCFWKHLGLNTETKSVINSIGWNYYNQDCGVQDLTPECVDSMNGYVHYCSSNGNWSMLNLATGVAYINASRHGIDGYLATPLLNALASGQATLMVYNTKTPWVAPWCCDCNPKDFRDIKVLTKALDIRDGWAFSRTGRAFKVLEREGNYSYLKIDILPEYILANNGEAITSSELWNYVKVTKVDGKVTVEEKQPSAYKKQMEQELKATEAYPEPFNVSFELIGYCQRHKPDSVICRLPPGRYFRNAQMVINAMPVSKQ